MPNFFLFFIKRKREKKRSLRSRVRGILAHQDVLLPLGIAPSDQVREQIRAGRRPESLLRRDRLYVVRRHLRVIARERFCGRDGFRLAHQKRNIYV